MIQRILLFALLLISKAGLSQDSSIVYFDFDRYDITPAAQQILDRLAAKPNLFSVVIYGHTDQLGSNGYNDRLSVKRAETVKDYLASRGIISGKIKIVKGFGETLPVFDKLDAVSRRANRRVVILANYEVTARDSVIMEVPKKEEPKNSPSATSPSRKPLKEDLITEITDSATREGDNIVLKNINFYGGRHVFLPQSYVALGELLYAMQTIPSLEIEIQGHICCIDGEQDGIDLDTGEPFLSYNRARAVYEYLAEKGIDRKRMKYRGYGHKSPIIQFERTEDERTTNRRVEIRILKK